MYHRNHKKIKLIILPLISQSSYDIVSIAEAQKNLMHWKLNDIACFKCENVI